MNIKLSNGQYRYSSGMFKNTIQASKRKKEVVQNGIRDAFVVAYYNGKRISLRKAKELVSSNGEKIIESTTSLENTKKEMPTNKKVKYIESKDKLFSKKINPIVPEKYKYQYVSKKDFENFPEKELRLLNKKQLFYYDRKSQKIKSAFINSSILPDLIFAYSNQLYVKRIFENELNSLFFKTTLTPGRKIPGDLMDELLRLSILNEVSTEDSSIKVIFDGTDETKKKQIEDLIIKFNLEVIENE